MLVLAAAVSLSPAAELLYDLTLTDDIGEVCLLALSRIFAPLHHVFEGLLATGVLIAVVDRTRAWLESRRLLGAMESLPPAAGSRLEQACWAAGLDPNRLRVVHGSPLPALTVGALRPMVLVTDTLESVLDQEELVAVVAHEAEHVRRSDPLRLSVMRAVSRSLFWLPAVRALEQHVAEVTELRADRAAARRSGIAAASAIIALVRQFGRVSVPAFAAGMSPHEFVEVRVRLLAGQNARLSSRASPASLIGTVAVLLLLWVAAAAELHDNTHKRHLAADAHGCVEHSRQGIPSIDCSEATAVQRPQGSSRSP
jgi:Zn-dependent protease with chaperone function